MRSRFSSTVLFTVFSKNSFETCAFRSLSVFPLAGEHANTRKHWFHGISFEEKLEVDPNLTQWELNEENKVTVGQTLFLIFLTMFIFSAALVILISFAHQETYLQKTGSIKDGFVSPDHFQSEVFKFQFLQLSVMRWEK